MVTKWTVVSWVIPVNVHSYYETQYSLHFYLLPSRIIELEFPYSQYGYHLGILSMNKIKLCQFLRICTYVLQSNLAYSKYNSNKITLNWIYIKKYSWIQKQLNHDKKPAPWTNYVLIIQHNTSFSRTFPASPNKDEVSSMYL